MLSTVGGSMGLYIGASFLTVFEIIHFFCGAISNALSGLPL
jgi:hypothetical protein